MRRAEVNRTGSSLISLANGAGGGAGGGRGGRPRRASDPEATPRPGAAADLGGELAAAVLCDSIIRLLPGIIGDESSALYDTFQDNLLSPPIYTRPENYKGMKVPKVLLSGNDKEIQKWNDEKSIERTKLLRPNLFDND